MDFLTEHSESCNRAPARRCARRAAPRRAAPGCRAAEPPSRRGFQLNHVHALFTSHKRTGSLVPRHRGDVNDDDGTTAIRPIRPDVVLPRRSRDLPRARPRTRVKSGGTTKIGVSADGRGII